MLVLRFSGYPPICRPRRGAQAVRDATIPPAGVSTLFPNKDHRFVAALEECFTRTIAALEVGADSADERQPDSVLFAIGDAYAELVADGTLLLLRVHAHSGAENPTLGEALG